MQRYAPIFIILLAGFLSGLLAWQFTSVPDDSGLSAAQSSQLDDDDAQPTTAGERVKAAQDGTVQSFQPVRRQLRPELRFRSRIFQDPKLKSPSHIVQPTTPEPEEAP